MDVKAEDSTKSKGIKKYLHPLDDDEYELIKVLVKGEFCKPIKERTRREKSTVIKFWRNKSKFSVGGDSKLYFEGKEVVTKSNVRRIVDKTRDVCKAKSTKKLQKQVSHTYAGLSGRQISKFISCEANNDQVNKKPESIPENQLVRSQYQLCIIEIEYHDENTLLLMWLVDVFSQLSFLVTLRNYLNAGDELERILNEHGLPGHLQILMKEGDFKDERKKVSGIIKVCTSLDVPYSLVATETLKETGNEVLFEKVYQDVGEMKGDRQPGGMVWGERILKYTRESNIRPRKEHAWKSPFEVFHGKPWRFEKEKLKLTTPSFVPLKRSRESEKLEEVTRTEQSDLFSNAGFEMTNNTPCYCDSQFEVVSHIMEGWGNAITPSQVRSEVVSYLEQHPNNVDGFPLDLYTGTPWCEYLANMSKDDSQGDQTTLQAISNSYNLMLNIVSNLKNQKLVVICPYIPDEQTRSVYIGEIHKANSSVTQYVTLRPNGQDVKVSSGLSEKEEAFPHLYISHPELLPPPATDGRVTISILDLVKMFGAFSKCVIGLKKILDVSLWKFASLELKNDGMSWFRIANILLNH